MYHHGRFVLYFHQRRTIAQDSYVGNVGLNFITTSLATPLDMRWSNPYPCYFDGIDYLAQFPLPKEFEACADGQHRLQTWYKGDRSS